MGRYDHGVIMTPLVFICIAISCLLFVYAFRKTKGNMPKGMRNFAIILIIISVVMLIQHIRSILVYEGLYEWYYISAIVTYVSTYLCIANNTIILFASKHIDKTSSNKNIKSLSVCPKCGLPISENKKFCTNCGEKLNTN